MAAYTSSQTGNWSSASTWGGSGPPGAGDTATIANGHTVTVDANTTVGSKASGIGHAVTINGASSGSFGTLQVSAGVTLTLRGFDTSSNKLMVVNRYGLFAPQPGSIVLGDVPSDFGSIILNNGRFEAIGSSGSHIAFSVPSGNVNWGVAATSEARTPAVYDRQGAVPLICVSLAFTNVSNAAGTAIGSSGDSSLTINSSTPSLTTAKSSLAAIASTGDYYVDHDAGIVYAYGSTFSGLAFNSTYKHLDKTAANWKGWGIVSAGSNSSNALLIDYCDFSYMGTANSSYTLNATSRRAPLNPDGHVCATTDSTRVFYCKRSSFKSCMKYIQLCQCVGTSGDPVLITGNTFNDGTGGVNNDGINNSGVYSQYITVDSNTWNNRGVAIDLSAGYSWASTPVIPLDSTGWAITNNTGFVGGTFVLCKSEFWSGSEPDARYGSRPTTPGLYIAGNDIRGAGNLAAPDGRMLQVSGKSGSPCIVENNYIHHCSRIGHRVGSYVTFRNNRFYQFYHHGLTGQTNDDVYVTDTSIYNNMFACDRTGTNTSSTSAAIQLAYNHRIVENNLTIANNTVDGWLYGLLDFSDIPDSGGGPALATNIIAVNNIVSNGKYSTGTTSSGSLFTYAHVTEYDFNNNYSQATAYGSGLTNNANPTGFYQGSSKYNRLTSGSRNIPGVALFDASYTTAQTGRSLVYTVNTLGTDHTLAWGGGAAVQLIQDSGTSAGGGLRTIGCVGKGWASSTTNLRAKWLWVVSGTGAGQARGIASGTANTAYSLSISSNTTSGVAVGTYYVLGSGSPELSKNAVVRVSSVDGSGKITGLDLVSGGAFASTPANPVTLQRITGSASGTISVNLSWAPGLVLVPDLATAVDATSVFAVVNSQVTLTDSGGTNTVKAGLYLPNPSNWQSAVQIPTSTQTDTGITVAVNKSPTGNPNFAGAGLSSVATDYKINTSSAAKDAGTSDNAPSTDYFGAARPFNSLYDIGFYEYTISTATCAVTLGSDTAAGAFSAGAAGNQFSSGITLGADTIAGAFTAGSGAAPASFVAALTLRNDTIATSVTTTASPSSVSASLLLPGDTATSVLHSGPSLLSYLSSSMTLIDDLVIGAVASTSGSYQPLTAYPDPFAAIFRLRGT